MESAEQAAQEPTPVWKTEAGEPEGSGPGVTLELIEREEVRKWDRVCESITACSIHGLL